jgi:hypothetical protein
MQILIYFAVQISIGANMTNRSYFVSLISITDSISEEGVYFCVLSYVCPLYKLWDENSYVYLCTIHVIK